ncbi:MAG: hypothetical protein ACOCQX_00920 [Candidatus Nanoarchaeia archaeon]
MRAPFILFSLFLALLLVGCQGPSQEIDGEELTDEQSIDNGSDDEETGEQADQNNESEETSQEDEEVEQSVEEELISDDVEIGEMI